MQVINLIAHTIPPRVSTYRYFALLQLLTLSHSFRRSRTNLKRQYHSIPDPTPNDISFIAATTLKRRKYHHCDKRMKRQPDWLQVFIQFPVNEILSG